MGAVVVLSFFAVMITLAVRSPRTALLAMVFFAPWGGADVDLGLRVSVYQVTLAAVILVTAVRSLQPGWKIAPVAARRLLMAFILYAVLWSLLQLAFIPQLNIGSGALRLPLARATIQIGLFIFTIMPALLIGWSMRSREDLEAIFRTYIFSVAVLAAIGWLQLLIWYGTGTNPLPIGVINQWLGGLAETREGAFAFELLDIKRMNSFAGEPRNMGGVCAFAMLMIQAAALTMKRVPGRQLAALWLFFLVTMLATFSSSAPILWLLGSAVTLVAVPLFGQRIARTPGQLGSVVGAVLLVITLAVVTAQARGIPVIEIASQRTLERIDNNGAVEDFDLAILDYLRAHPEALTLGAGLGNAHLYAAPYIAPEFLWYAEGQVFTAKAQYLRLVSELGVVGLLLFLAWYGVLVIDAARAARQEPQSAYAAVAPIAAMTLAVFLVAGQYAGEFWILSGALAVTVTALRRQAPGAPEHGLPGGETVPA